MLGQVTFFQLRYGSVLNTIHFPVFPKKIEKKKKKFLYKYKTGSSRCYIRSYIQQNYSKTHKTDVIPNGNLAVRQQTGIGPGTKLLCRPIQYFRYLTRLITKSKDVGNLMPEFPQTRQEEILG